MRARLGGYCAAGEHSRELLDATAEVERLDVGAHRSIVAALGDAEVRVGEGRDLRQMRNAEHLTVLAERLQQLADGRCYGSADPRVDFVEDERGHCGDFARDDLDR